MLSYEVAMSLDRVRVSNALYTPDPRHSTLYIFELFLKSVDWLSTSHNPICIVGWIGDQGTMVINFKVFTISSYNAKWPMILQHRFSYEGLLLPPTVEPHPGVARWE